MPPFSTNPPQGDINEAEKYRPYLTNLYKKGFRYVRLSITDAQWYGGGNPDKRLQVLKSVGFNVQYGASYIRFLSDATRPANCMTPNYHKTIWEPLVLQRFPLAIAEGYVDIWSLGNEHEEGIRAEPVISLVRVGNVVTATMATDHYYSVGDTVAIAGATPGDFNSSVGWNLYVAGTGSTITSVPTSKTFTYVASGADGTATGSITAKMTVDTYISLLKKTAVSLRAIAAGMGNTSIKFVYSSTENPIGVWQNVGITPGVDFDYYGMNGYGNRADQLYDFEIRQVSNQAAFGDSYMLTEWNLDQPYNDQALYSPDIKTTERYTEERINVLRRLDVKHAYYFKVDGEPRAGGFGGGWMLYNYINNTPRNAYYALIKERRSHIIRDITRYNNIYDVSSPIVTLRKPRAGIDRGKCIDFNQSNSGVSFVLPSSFSVAKCRNFSIAVRVYTRGLGGLNQGMILDSIGGGPQEGFCNLRVNANGSGEYRCEAFRYPTNGVCTSGGSSIVYNTWQALVVTFDDTLEGQKYPRMYIDGLDRTSNVVANSGDRGTSPAGVTAYIGNTFNLTKNFNGLIDDLYIYNRVLSSEEICSFKNGQIPGQYILGYNMDETTGNLTDLGPDRVVATPFNVTQNTTGQTILT